MLVCVFGPLHIVRNEAVVTLGHQETVVLARLVRDLGRVVMVDQLLDALWSAPPRTARKTLQGYVHRLRRVLGSDSIVREGDGYRLADVAVDVDAVEVAIRESAQLLSQGQVRAARDQLRREQATFRGDPLPELVDDLSMIGARRRLQEVESRFVDMLYDAELAAGNHLAIIAELEEHVARQPLRERLWAQLARALAASGRQSDALQALSRARLVLATEVGLSPGPQITALERAILEQTVDVH